ncbi:ChaN family lipoprotein [Tateyamaria omphalii]|uniref:ChaN family lipoprotein n=1 Tax=Tateyamaria omphalii TaxID=299262 RepID=UPI001C990484|nr:ChaN family lipoprotein [Tateyamaria omphalii]MBY5934837.1 ChaN family lipoprotein [Tateyamaria omphalii]
MMFRTALLAAAATLSPAAVSFAATDWSDFSGDVLILGEFHDNATHHAEQAKAIRLIEPTAVVYEMLTPAEADALGDAPRNPDSMAAAADGFHWSNIADYADVLAASPVIVGAALSRDDMRGAFTDGAAAVFGPDAERFGLTTALPEDEQAVREQAQFDAHCEAMPLEMMGGMVEAQRLRDAAFARTVMDALDTHGSPVVLITGNGHARMDWGVPVYLSRVQPDLDVTSVGQGERQEPPEGVYSWTLNGASSPDREDPCAVFNQ